MRLLIVLDDVWNEAHARELMLGRNCVYMVTTRVRNLPARLVKSVDVFHVRELKTDEGLQLLCNIAQDAVLADPGQARMLVEAVSGLP